MRILILGAGLREQKPDDDNEYITLDIIGAPDVKHDMNSLPLPFDDNYFSEIWATHCLEHWGMQGDWRYFFEEWNEYYRILKKDGMFRGIVPFGTWTWGDPGHTRVITNGTLAFLSRKQYEKQIGNTAMTDYRFIYKGDFEAIKLLVYDTEFVFWLKKI